MRFKNPQLKISAQLSLFASKKIKEQNIPLPRASKKIIRQLASVYPEIEKKGLPSHLVLKKLKGKLGKGIFLHPRAHPILKGDAIAPYAGQVFLSHQNDQTDSDYVFALLTDLHLTKEEQLLLDPETRYHPRRLYSLDVDAEKTGNFTRFINHSEKPNIEADFLKIPKNEWGIKPSPFEIVYIACKTIQPGEQLLVSYEGEERSYWGALKIKPFPMTPKTFKLNASLEVV